MSADALIEETTEQRIRRVATQMFYERGYHGTSMRDIAAGAGIKAGSMYNHYAGKQEILFRICHDTARDLQVGAARRLEGVDEPAEQLERFVHWHVQFHARNRFAARVADDQLEALTPEHRAAVVEARDRHEALLKEILERGERDAGWTVENRSVISFAIGTMCTEVDSWYREDGPLTPEQIGDVYAQFILRGLRAVPGEAPAPRRARPARARAVRRAAGRAARAARDGAPGRAARSSRAAARRGRRSGA
ncbi:TetR/AcrR family transcriptional regulator [Conexibacter arvalis]|uniref:AcrR family transcriptional regulator n=1 Tax=Conexibacter arvalis TaxID=912552 RepID=A0A840ICG7_9ACTN|nr:TetR/AcrR family transcriptional regulator [Conexibacter arvalis]MBB4662025.1 AcrR family transcriptional regulator [Conexibacter arvalis]